MTDNPYSPPQAKTIDSNGKPETIAKVGFWLLLVSSLLGVLCIVAGVILTFQAVKVYGAGPNGEWMMAGIRASFFPKLWLLAFQVPAVVLVLMAVFKDRYDGRWFYRGCLVLAIFMMITFPFGAVFGLTLLIALLVRKKQFLS
ncbi:hypothetical protein KFE80_12150 [bacterium SCSIO 12696]|nr:hypothetical protein KFE80_12150 [bacterium SCSIO 12696]